MSDIKILGLIPARGGSKSIPRKNLYPLCGRMLIEYTFDAAKKSRHLSRIVLTTDDQEIASLAKKRGIEVPFIRPASLASDDSPTLAAVQHAVTYLENNEGYHPEIVVLLQPTSPLRKSSHIDEAIELLIGTGADAIVSVEEVPHRYNPCSIMTIREGRLIAFFESEQTEIFRRQDKPKVYARNGAAVYAVRHETLMQHNSLFGEDCRPLIMKPEESVDIDTLYDVRMAESLLGMAEQIAGKSENEEKFS
jgi:CMP-N-acetylneuraminic acid synthetase